MLIDHIDHLIQYSVVPKRALGTILEFIQACKDDKKPDGKYALYGEDLYALVQTYQTKKAEDARLEAHRHYADLQVVLSGSEHVYWTPNQNLTIFDDQLDTKDMVKYQDVRKTGIFQLDSDMFAYFAPWDAHAPSISCLNGSPTQVHKIVFKIRVNHR